MRIFYRLRRELLVAGCCEAALVVLGVAAERTVDVRVGGGHDDRAGDRVAEGDWGWGRQSEGGQREMMGQKRRSVRRHKKGTRVAELVVVVVVVLVGGGTKDRTQRGCLVNAESGHARAG